MRHIGTMIMASALVASLLLAACGEAARPTRESWLAQWTDLTESLPSEAELGDPPDAAMCARTLARIREAAPEIRLTPDLAADAPVEEWVSVAEATFFECPPESGEIRSFAEAFEELDRIEREVAAGLDL